MKYRDTSTRVPLDEKRQAQKSVRDSALQESPVRSEIGHVGQEEGYRPGAPHSAHTLNEEMQRSDGWRPGGSYSPSSRNDSAPGKRTSQWTRRMVVDDSHEGQQFEAGMETGREDVIETYEDGGARFTVRSGERLVRRRWHES